MRILSKLTIKNLKLNKKRTVAETIGIILAVALICATGCLFTSFQKTLVANTIEETGYYHLNLEGINQKKYDEVLKHKNVDHVNTIYRLGWATFDSTRKDTSPYIKIFSIDRTSFDNHKFEITEGRFPIDNDEILISNKALTDGNLKIGDTIELDVGERRSNEGFKLVESNPYNKDLEYLAATTHKTYKIVGVTTRTYWNGSFFALTTKEKSDDIRAYIALKNPKEYKTTSKELTLDIKTANYEAGTNHELLRWEIFAFSDSTITMLYTVCSIVIAIIMFTSIFCIRNSFAISTLEKMKMYGMLASIGATKKQIKNNVIKEALILGLIAIPIGILGGLLAVYILIKVVNAIAGGALFGNSGGIVLNITLLPIALAAILGLTVIYFSSISSAKKASKASPIENLRNANDIKMNSKKLKTPLFIRGIFKTGGVLAYKNLKRSKKKYRTTIISLAISIFTFISMNSFINEALVRGSDYYKDYPYNIYINPNQDKMLKDEEITAIRNMDDVKESYLLYQGRYTLDIKDLSHVITNKNEDRDYDIERGIGIFPIALDDDTFRDYAKKIGVDYEYAKDKGIIYNKIRYNDSKSQKTIEGKRYSYKKGDIVKTIVDYDKNNEFSFTVAASTMTPPTGIEERWYTGGYVIFDQKYASSLELSLDMILINSKDPDNLERELLKMDPNMNIQNMDEAARSQRSTVIVFSIFLYGFITVITLIGVTNIFNTITSNMELRSREFAILKSIGMTKKEFNRMVNLETLFYSFKSLLYGIIAGLGGSYLIHLAFQENMETIYRVPLNAIVISIIFVTLIVFLIMHYSISKINRQNTIETIRKENI